jgi:type I restriction enzyme S subunit
MSEWSTNTLQEITKKITDGSHQSPKEYSGGYPMPSVKDMTDNGFNLSNCKTISEQDYELLVKQGCRPEKGDVLIAKDGSVMKHVFVVKENPEYVLLSSIAIVRPEPSKVVPEFLSYAIKSPAIMEQILTNFVSGSGVPRIVLKDFKKVEISYPPLPEQKAIAEVLSSLDDKIDLLHRNNKTLEQMAETLFRQWLEQAQTKPDTCIKALDEVAIMQNGHYFKSSEFVAEGLNTLEVFKIGHISLDGGLRTSAKTDFVPVNDNIKKYMLNKRDIVFGMTDMKDNVVVLGVPALVDKSNKYVNNYRVARVYLKENSEILDILLLYMQMSDKNFISDLQAKANSGVQVNLSTETIRGISIIVPSKEEQQKILPHIQCIYDKLDLNREQIQKLTGLRDNLLPKLMSGQVRVKTD